MTLSKEFRTIFDYSNLLLTLRFGPNDDDSQFNKTDPYLLEMSKHLHFIHVFNMTTIIGLIEMGLPSTKINIQQQIGVSEYEHRIYDTTYYYWSLAPYYELCEIIESSKSNRKYSVEISCGAWKCQAIYYFILPYDESFYYENFRHIANKMRLAMRHNLAGAVAVYPSYDDKTGRCPIEQDTFLDFRPVKGVNLKIPTRDIPFPRVQVIHNAITVSLDEMAQEAQLCKQNDHCNVKV